MENISLLLSGECSRGLPCISFNSDENWDVTCTHLYQRTDRAEGQLVACVLQRRGGGARDSHEQGDDVELDSNDFEISDRGARPCNRASGTETGERLVDSAIIFSSYTIRRCR